MSKSMRCPIRDIAAALRLVARNGAKWRPTGCTSLPMDVRLQVCADGTWAIHTGDSSYDVDHRGVWGASSVPLRGRFDSISLAKELWNEAVDQAVDGFDGPVLHYAK